MLNAPLPTFRSIVHRGLQLSAIAGGLLTSSCELFRSVLENAGTAVLYEYSLVTFCRGVEVSDEDTLVEDVFVYRIEAIDNNSPADVRLRPQYFYVHSDDIGIVSTAAPMLTTMTDLFPVASGVSVMDAGLVAVRSPTAASDSVAFDRGSGQLRVVVPMLQYNTRFAGGDTRFAGIHVGRPTMLVSAMPCVIDNVLDAADRP